MNPETPDNCEFERRAAALLRESVDDLDGATRSRLTQARHRALEQAPRPRARAAWLSWAPTGAAAVAVLVTLGYLSQVGFPGRDETGKPAATVASATNGTINGASTGATNGVANGSATGEAAGAFDDLALLADSEALELSQDDDLDFYEWAADGGTQAVGT